MAEWSRNKVDSSQLNNGNEFDNNSSLALDEINAVVNGGLYSQDFSEHLADTPDTSEAGNVGTPAVSLVDNIVGDKTFKKFKFSNLKGQKGDKGLGYLTVNRAFASRYPVGNIAPYYLNDFNRTPVVNDIFSTLCANKYYTTFKIVNTETRQMQSIAEVNIQGPQGIEYLTTTRNFTNEYNIGDTTSINNNEFNRTPVVNDIFSTLCANKYYTTFKVLSVSETSCSSQVISKVNLKGEKGNTGNTGDNGKDALVCNSVILTSGQLNIDLSFTDFNRMPVVGDSVILIVEDSIMGKYITVGEVKTLASNYVTVNVTSKIMLTSDGIQDDEVISRGTLPTASADSPDFVQTEDGLVYKKSTASESGTTYSYEEVGGGGSGSESSVTTQTFSSWGDFYTWYTANPDTNIISASITITETPSSCYCEYTYIRPSSSDISVRNQQTLTFDTNNLNKNIKVFDLCVSQGGNVGFSCNISLQGGAYFKLNFSGGSYGPFTNQMEMFDLSNLISASSSSSAYGYIMINTLPVNTVSIKYLS